MGQMRQRMTEELRLRGYSERTVESYVAQVKRFAKHYMRPPEELGADEIRAYLLHITVEEKLATATVNQAIFALRFFYTELLGREWTEKFVCQRIKRRKLRAVLSEAEVVRLLSATSNLKHRAIVMTLYATGLRLDELLSIRLQDLDRESMRLRVVAPKGGRERFVMLSERLVQVLRDYIDCYQPTSLLFFSRDRERRLDPSTVQRVVKAAARRAGIHKQVSPHVLRHSFATHLMERGTSVVYIQELLGHRAIQTTLGYVRVCRGGATRVTSPLDRLELDST
jgi:site-specific recombinase XerD